MNTFMSPNIPACRGLRRFLRLSVVKLGDDPEQTGHPAKLGAQYLWNECMRTSGTTFPAGLLF